MDGPSINSFALSVLLCLSIGVAAIRLPIETSEVPSMSTITLSPATECQCGSKVEETTYYHFVTGQPNERSWVCAESKRELAYQLAGEAKPSESNGYVGGPRNHRITGPVNEL